MTHRYIAFAYVYSTNAVNVSLQIFDLSLEQNFALMYNLNVYCFMLQ